MIIIIKHSKILIQRERTMIMHLVACSKKIMTKFLCACVHNKHNYVQSDTWLPFSFQHEKNYNSSNNYYCYQSNNR